MPAKKNTSGSLDLNLKTQLNSFQKAFEELAKKVGMNLNNLQSSVEGFSDDLLEASKGITQFTKQSSKKLYALEESFENLTSGVYGFSRSLDYTLRSNRFDDLIMDSKKLGSVLREVGRANKEIYIKNTMKQVGGLFSEFRNLSGLTMPPIFANISEGLKGPMEQAKVMNNLKESCGILEGAYRDLKKVRGEAYVDDKSEIAIQSQRRLIAAQKFQMKLVSKLSLLYIGLAASVRMSIAPMGQVLLAQEKIIKTLPYLNTGFLESIQYIGNVNKSLMKTHGLLDFEEGITNFGLLAEEFREFLKPTNNIITGVNSLQAAVGYAASDSVMLAARLKGIGVAKYEDVFYKISNQIVSFAKNTDLSSRNIAELIQKADPLIYKFPKAVEQDLIPQILSIGSAFKSVHLDAKEMVGLLSQSIDLRNTQAMLRNALISGRNGLSFESLMEGKDLDKAAVEMNKFLRDSIKNHQGISAAVQSEVLSQLTGFSKEYIYRIRNMTDQEYKVMNRRLINDKKLSNDQDALNKALSQQLEGPLNSLKALGVQVKMLLMKGALNMMWAVKVLKGFVDILSWTIQKMNKFPAVVGVVGTTIVGLGLVIGAKLSWALTKAIYNTEMFTLTLNQMSTAMKAAAAGSVAGGAAGGAAASAAKKRGWIMATLVGASKILWFLTKLVFKIGAGIAAFLGAPAWVTISAGVLAVAGSIWWLCSRFKKNTESVDNNTEALTKSNEIEQRKLGDKDKKDRKFASINRYEDPFQQMNFGAGESALNNESRFGPLNKFQTDILKKLMIDNEQRRLNGESFNATLVDQLTSNRGSKAELGDSIGQFTTKMIESLGDGKFKVTLADDQTIEFDSSNQVSNSYRSINNLLKSRGIDPIREEWGGIMNLQRNSNLLEKLSNRDFNQLSIHINHITDLLKKVPFEFSQASLLSSKLLEEQKKVISPIEAASPAQQELYNLGNLNLQKNLLRNMDRSRNSISNKDLLNNAFKYPNLETPKPELFEGLNNSQPSILPKKSLEEREIPSESFLLKRKQIHDKTNLLKFLQNSPFNKSSDEKVIQRNEPSSVDKALKLHNESLSRNQLTNKTSNTEENSKLVMLNERKVQIVEGLKNKMIERMMTPSLMSSPEESVIFI